MFCFEAGVFLDALERFAPDVAEPAQTCFDAMDWELTPDLEAYFLKRDFSSHPAVR